MTAPALDNLRDEIANLLYEDYYRASATNQNAKDIIEVLTRHIPADVLAGLLDRTMVAVPVGDLMFGAGDFARLELEGRRNITISLTGAMFEALDARARAEGTFKTTWVRDLIKWRLYDDPHN